MMKLKKEVQRVAEFITTGAGILLAITIESEWTKGYLLFAAINTALLLGGALLLKKYGRYEEDPE